MLAVHANATSGCDVTVRLVEPLIEPDVALMVVLPAASAVANPPLRMVAIDGALEVQAAVLVRSW